MYDPNFRSFIRTMIRKKAQHYQDQTGQLPINEISREVVDELTNRQHSESEWLESLYALVYEEAKEILRRPEQNRNTQIDEQQLLNLGVPSRPAKIIARINRSAVYVPSCHALKLLYGPNRLTDLELSESVLHYQKKSKEIALLSVELERLRKAPGNYYT